MILLSDQVEIVLLQDLGDAGVLGNARDLASSSRRNHSDVTEHPPSISVNDLL